MPPSGPISGFDLYLTDDARERIELVESPVHLLVDIMSCAKDGYTRTSEGLLQVGSLSKVSRLQDFLSLYFVPDIVASIGRYYDELGSSCPIPQTYLSKYSLAQLGEHSIGAVACLTLGPRSEESGGREGCASQPR